MFRLASIWLLLYSETFLTSKILILLTFKVSTNEVAETDLSVEILFLLFFQFLNPPFKYPMQLSYPTLESLVIASVSFPSGDIKRIFWLMSLIKVPTHGANPPSIPIKIESGINPFTNLDWWRTSKITADPFIDSSLNSIDP